MDWQLDYSVVFQFLFLIRGSVCISDQHVTSEQSSDTGRIFSLSIIQSFLHHWTFLFQYHGLLFCLLYLTPRISTDFTWRCTYFVRSINGLSAVGITGDIQFSSMGFFYMSKCCKTTLGFPVMALCTLWSSIFDTIWNFWFITPGVVLNVCDLRYQVVGFFGGLSISMMKNVHQMGIAIDLNPSACVKA